MIPCWVRRRQTTLPLRPVQSPHMTAGDWRARRAPLGDHITDTEYTRDAAEVGLKD